MTLSNNHPRNPAIACNVELPPGKYNNQSTMDLYRRLMYSIITENDLHPKNIDGLLTIPTVGTYGRPVTHERLYDELGIQPSFAMTMYAGGVTYSQMIHQAVMAIQCGVANAVLCLGVGKFPPVDEGGEEMVGRVSHREFELPYGPFIPALYALPAKRYLYEFDISKAGLAHVSISTRKWALDHPDAYMNDKGEITQDDVLNSPKIADPFHQLHCSIPTEGGGAFLITTEELAKSITDQPAYILGIGEKHSHGYISQSPSFTTMAPKETGAEAFEMASITPDEIDVAEIYDAFASNPPMYLEDLGFAEKGEGIELFRSGETAPSGSLPVNTNGGLLSYGHGGAVGGMSVINEAISQTMGTARGNQVKDVQHVLAHTYGGMMSEHCTIIFGRSSHE